MNAKEIANGSDGDQSDCLMYDVIYSVILLPKYIRKGGGMNCFHVVCLFVNLSIRTLEHTRRHLLCLPDIVKLISFEWERLAKELLTTNVLIIKNIHLNKYHMLHCKKT